MALWKKVLLGLLLAGVIMLGLAATLVHLYVTPERVQGLVQEGLESSLHRKVNLGAVKVGLLRGITLSQLTIHTKQREGTLLTAENIDLSYDFSALLHGELLLNKILIKAPQLRLVRQADGRLNIADLLGETAAEQQSAPTAARPESDASAGVAGGIPLRVKQFALQGGTLLFIDRKMNAQSPYRYRLDDLDIAVDNFSLDESFPVKLSASLNGAPISLDLHFGPADGLKSLQLKSRQLNLVPFLPYFQENLPGSLGRGLLSTELVVQKQPRGFSVTGQTVVEDLDVSLDLDQPLHWNKVRISLDQDLFYRLADEVLDVKRFAVDIDGLQLAYLGKVQLGGSAEVAGEASLKIVDLREISALLPHELRQQVAAYGMAGNLEAQLQLSGPATGIEVIQRSRFKAADLQASIGALRPALNGTFDYSAGRLQGEQIDIELQGQHLVIDLDATRVFSALPDLKLKLTSDKINLDELIPQAQNNELTGAKAAVAESAPKFPAPSVTALKGGSAPREAAVTASPLEVPVTGSFELGLNQLLYRGLLLEKIQGLALLRDGRLKITHLTATTAEGDAVLSAEAQLEKTAIPVQGDFKVENINLSRVTDVLLPEGKGSTSGFLTLQSRFSTLAMAADPLAKLTAQGVFDLRDGKIKGSPLLEGLARFLANPELKLVGFSRFHGGYGLKKGRGTIDARLESRRVTLAPKGSFTLAGNLNLALETRISPEVMAKAGIGGKGTELLKDDKGWSLLPLKVKGNYNRPHFSLDSRGVKKQLKKGVVKELGRQLQKKLGGGSEDPQKQQLQKLLDGTLNKLFGQ